MTDEVNDPSAQLEEQSVAKEPSHNEELQTEEPKTEEPKTEEPQSEEPKIAESTPEGDKQGETEEPKTDEQKPEEPKTERKSGVEQIPEPTKQSSKEKAVDVEKQEETKPPEVEEEKKKSQDSVLKETQKEERPSVPLQEEQQRGSKATAAVQEERATSAETKQEMKTESRAASRAASSESLEKKGRDSLKEDKEQRKSRTERLSSKAKNVVGSSISIHRLSAIGEFYDRSKGARYMNSYKLDSDNPFNPDKVRKILESVMVEALENLTYDPEKCPKQAKWASSAIRAKVKELQFDRYKMICIVTIGEKNSQDILVTCRFLWDIDRDRYATYTIENTYVFGIAQCFGVYYE